jgi:hypothetical protein
MSDLHMVEETLRDMKRADDWESGERVNIVIRPPARLRKRANTLVGRIYNRVYF